MNLYKLTWRDFKEIILREGKKHKRRNVWYLSDKEDGGKRK